MQRLNRYYRRSRISETRFRLLVQHFALDLSAAQAAQLAGISHRSAITIFGKIRRRIAEECERQSPLGGEVEVDESYFGARRVRGKRGRGASGKTLVFGVFKRNGSVYTEVVPDCKKRTLLAVIWGGSRSTRSSTRIAGAATTAWSMSATRSTSGLIMRPTSSRGASYVNGIESFWSYAKRRLQKFNGVPACTFYLHLKECEYRFNNRRRELSTLLLELLEKHSLQSSLLL